MPTNVAGPRLLPCRRALDRESSRETSRLPNDDDHQAERRGKGSPDGDPLLLVPAFGPVGLYARNLRGKDGAGHRIRDRFPSSDRKI
jgi:hypothetical protein